MLKTKIYDEIKKWKEEPNGRTALLIEGARRAGRSTIVERFVKNEYFTYILLSCSRCE